MKITVVDKNNQGGYYEKGRSFTRPKWTEIIDSFQAELDSAGKCTIHHLTTIAKIGKHLVEKAVNYHTLGFIPSLQKKTPKGVGSLKGLKMKHHTFIYALYLSNPALPNYGYCKEMQKKFGISLFNGFIRRRFKSIGPFKGNYRKTSCFPSAKFSRSNT